MSLFPHALSVNIEEKQFPVVESQPLLLSKCSEHPEAWTIQEVLSGHSADLFSNPSLSSFGFVGEQCYGKKHSILFAKYLDSFGNLNSSKKNNVINRAIPKNANKIYFNQLRSFLGSAVSSNST